MGSIGNSSSNNMSLTSIYNTYNVGNRAKVMQDFRDGNITLEARDAAIKQMNEGADKIVNRMVDNFTPASIKALSNTMDRQFELTGGSDITGNMDFYKTDNGYVLTASATRSNFRVFMDNDGNVTRMPANEMKTAQRIRLGGKTVYELSKRFEDIRKKNK